MATDEAVFKALADASRRHLLDALDERNGQSLRELCAGLDMARQSVSKHLAVLEAAELVTTQRRGREKLHYLNAAPINAIADRWINQFDRERVRAMADLTAALEAPMSETRFTYTAYINTTPEQAWKALTDPWFTRRYWGVELESDWKPGSSFTWTQKGITVADPEQIVLEADPPRRLSYTWHTLTPELGEAHELSDETIAKVGTERRSKVTFEIEPLGERVRLTLVHDDFEPGSRMLELISGGWPSVISSMKTLLETDAEAPA